MHRESGKESAPVKIVLRKAGLPESRQNLVALLHEMAAFVDLAQEKRDGNILGDVSFNACEFTGVFVNPHVSVDFGENGCNARRGFERGIGRHFIFGKEAAAARFASDQGKVKCVARRVNKIVPVFSFLRIFFQCIALRAVVIDDERKGVLQAFKADTVGLRIRRVAIGVHGNLVHACAGGDDARNLYRCGNGIVRILPCFKAFDALIEVKGGFVLLLVGDDAVEELRWLGSHRRLRSWNRDHRLRSHVGRRSDKQKRDWSEKTFAHRFNGRKRRPSLLSIGFAGPSYCCTHTPGP